MTVLSVLALVAGVRPAAAAAAAGMDNRQVRIVAKVFNFLGKRPMPGASVVVVRGAADVAAVKAALAPMMVVEGGAGDAAGAFAVIVNSAAEAIAASRANPRVFTIGPEVGCVDTGACVLVVETQPQVSVYVSRAAASHAGIEFDTSFMMLITER
ncbi:MAG: hypothetical protein H7840_11380 [Alphaproteobacteria bacterium]